MGDRSYGTAALLALLFMSEAAFGAPKPSDAAEIFAEAKLICERDAGALWGRTLCGPMLLVDAANRTALANEQDGQRQLESVGDVFRGKLPPEVSIANTATEWAGKRWTQVQWPAPADPYQRRVFLAHEMFHRIQPDLGLTRPEKSNRHLDTLEGRYFLQLEWRALARALTASGERRRAAVADAIHFRHERYRRFPAAAEEESALEVNEGIAEYTGVMLGLRKEEDRIAFAVHDLKAFVNAPTFVRSFAYATGPAWGLLLDEADRGWKEKFIAGQRFDELAEAAIRLPPPPAGSVSARARKYDDGALYDSEVRRAREKQASLDDLKARLVDGPVLTLPLQRSKFQFNPQTVQPLGDWGTVYPTMRLVDEWGILTVEDGGVLVGNKRARVSMTGAEETGLRGKGWALTLNPGWSLRSDVRNGDFIVTRSP